MADRLHLQPKHREVLEALLREYLPDVEVWAYGSRVSGKSHDGSDLDLVLRGPGLEEIPIGQLGDFGEAVRESSIPFLVEARDWARLSERFHSEIERDHVALVTRAEQSAAGDHLFGPLPPDWEYTTLGAACESNGGDIQTGPFGSQLHASDYVPVGIPSIMPKNIGDNQIDIDGIAHISPQDANRLSRYLVQEGDIVYSRRGDVEKRALVRRRESGWLCGTGCLRIRFGENGVDSRYASYFLGHSSVREWIVRHAHGATMPNLNTSILSECPFVVPPWQEQRAIAHILGTLDDKIELNQHMNETLEAMAHALFKSWFVDFDPVRAKMEGQAPYLDPEIWNHFPSVLDDRGMPRGWNRTSLGEIITVLETGKRPRGGVVGITNGIPSVGAESISRVGQFEFTKTKYVPSQFFDEMATGHVSEGDVLVYKDGGKPGELRPAVTYTSRGFPFAEFCINEHVFRIRTEVFSQPFLYCLLSTEDAFWQMRELATGVAQPGLNRKAIKSLEFTMPESMTLIRAAESTLGPLIDGCNENSLNSLHLAQIRDALLPKLISGDIRLHDAEDMVEAVA